VSTDTYLNYHAEAGTKKDNDVFPFEHSVGKLVFKFRTRAYDVFRGSVKRGPSFFCSFLGVEYSSITLTMRVVNTRLTAYPPNF